MSLLGEWNMLLDQQTPVTAPSSLAFVAWLALIVVLHVVQNPGLRFGLVTARAIMALIFWHQLLQLVSSLVETSRAWPVWLLAGSAAIASEIILLTYDRPGNGAVGTMRTWLQRSLVGLRLVLVGLIAILLMEPALSREEEKNEERTIAVLVDASSSMTLPTRSGPDPRQSRSEVAANLLSGNDDPSSGLLARIRDGYNLRVYEFGATVRRTSNRWCSENLTKGKNAHNRSGRRKNICADLAVGSVDKCRGSVKKNHGGHSDGPAFRRHHADGRS